MARIFNTAVKPIVFELLLGNKLMFELFAFDIVVDLVGFPKTDTTGLQFLKCMTEKIQKDNKRKYLEWHFMQSYCYLLLLKLDTPEKRFGLFF